VTILSIFFGVLILVITEKGWEFAIAVGLKRALEFYSLLAIAGIGLLAVFVAFVGSLSAPKKPIEDDKNNS
jgi:hypothetical protein